MKKNLLLIDGHSIANRAYYGMSHFHNSSGEQLWMLHAFFQILLRILKQYEITHWAFAFDLPKATFRHKLDENYKANRTPPPQEFLEQLQALQALIEEQNLPHYSLEGYEADDVVGTLAQRAQGDFDQIYLLSGDRDYLQLVEENIFLLYPSSQEYKLFTPERVQTEYGCSPEHIVDLKALQGDASDNIKGLEGVGPKTAQEWLRRHTSISEMYAHWEELPSKQQKKMAGKEEYLNRMLQLVRIQRSIPLSKFSWTDLELSKETLQKLVNAFLQRQLRTCAQKYSEWLGQKSDFCSGISSEEGETEVQNQTILQNKLVDWIVEYPPSICEMEKAFQKETGNLPSFLYSAEIFCSKEKRKKKISVWEWKGISSKDNKADSILSSHLWVLALPEQKKIWVLNQFCLENEAQMEWVDILKKNQKKLLLFSFREFRNLLPPKLLEKLLDESCVEDLKIRSYPLGHQVNLQDYQDLITELSDPQSAADLQTAYRKEVQEQNWIAAAVFQTELYKLLERELQEKTKNETLSKLVEELDQPLQSLLFQMEQVGVGVDQKLLQKTSQEYLQKLKELEQEAEELLRMQVNLNSPKQLSQLLYSQLGIKANSKNPAKWSTDAQYLQSIQDQHPIIPLILEYRKLHKLESTYLSGLQKWIGADGRIHSAFHQTSTTTGRLSSSNPNLQNLPIRQKEGQILREAVVASPGYLLVDADYSQIELRLLAHMAQDEHLIEAFQKNSDIHKSTAAELFFCSEDEVTEEQRAVGKVINFSLIYGVTAYGLAQDLKISVAEASRYRTLYFQRYPRVEGYFEKIEKSLREKGFVETLFGRRRAFLNLEKAKGHYQELMLRAAKNAPIQGSAADLMRKAMIDSNWIFQEKIPQARMILQIHDELIFEVPEAYAQEAAVLLKNTMENVLQLAVPLIVEVGIGKNWMEAKH